ncbi:MAG: hypothetical protein AAFV45_06530 [Pseudomonadota bacterium]
MQSLAAFISKTIVTAAAITMAVVIGSSAITSADAAELVMFEEDGCEWCHKWNEEIGVVYDRTDEGRRAPLRRVDIHAPRPVDLREITRINFTPTFVVIENGKEYGRILGHPGEDFFWPMLQKILATLPQQVPSENDSARSFYEKPQPIAFQEQSQPKP